MDIDQMAAMNPLLYIQMLKAKSERYKQDYESLTYKYIKMRSECQQLNRDNQTLRRRNQQLNQQKIELTQDVLQLKEVLMDLDIVNISPLTLDDPRPLLEHKDRSLVQYQNQKSIDDKDTDLCHFVSRRKHEKIIQSPNTSPCKMTKTPKKTLYRTVAMRGLFNSPMSIVQSL